MRCLDEGGTVRVQAGQARTCGEREAKVVREPGYGTDEVRPGGPGAHLRELFFPRVAATRRVLPFRL